MLVSALSYPAVDVDATVTAQEWIEISAVLKFMPVTLLVAFASLKTELHIRELSALTSATASASERKDMGGDIVGSEGKGRWVVVECVLS